MNNKMELERVHYAFIERFENGIIDKIVCSYDGNCTIYFRQGEQKKIFTGCSSYNAQYGIPISNDGKLMFVSSWEKGLVVYDTGTGEIVWRYKRSRVTSITVREEFVIICRYGYAIIKLDIKTGQVLTEITGCSIERRHELNDRKILVESIRGKLCVIDIYTMEIVKRYGDKICNPNQCLSLLIQKVELEDNKLIISGLEDYANRNRYNENKTAYRRVIDEDFEELLH